MAKFLLRLKAQELRKEGRSVKSIAKELKVSKSSVSMWTQDILLRPEQVALLQKNMLDGAALGRMKSALLKKEEKLKRIHEAKLYGIKKLEEIDDREFLIAGLALYWGEGSRKKIEVSFCNSDAEMIKFFILWLQRCFSIDKDQLRLCIGINEIHKEREQVLKEYWEKLLNITEDHFDKISYKKVVNKKVYANYDTYFGTLRVRVSRSVQLHYKILGLIEGLKVNMPG